MSKYRTHNCGELTLNNKDQTIKLSGWINKKRDHGNLLFLDLRDHYGLTQCVIDEGKKIFKEVEKLPLETVLQVEGRVLAREKDTINKNLKYLQKLRNYHYLFFQIKNTLKKLD